MNRRSILKRALAGVGCAAIPAASIVTAPSKPLPWIRLKGAVMFHPKAGDTCWWSDVEAISQGVTHETRLVEAWMGLGTSEMRTQMVVKEVQP
jgi:hypothetical protein